MKPMSMRRGLPLIMYGPSIIFSMRSPLNGVPVWRQASSTRLVGCRWVSMIIVCSRKGCSVRRRRSGRDLGLVAGGADRRAGLRVGEALLRLLDRLRARGRLDAAHPRKVVAEVVLERVLVEVQALRRLVRQHLE